MNNNPQEKIAYALWMVQSAAKQAAISTSAGLSMMAIGWILLIHASFGVSKPEQKLPWAAAALLLIAPSLAVVRYGEERGGWAADGRAVFRWGRAQWEEKLMLPPKAEELKAIAELPAMPNEIPLLNLGQLLNASFVLIIGEQGSGKTTLAKMIGKERQNAGHSIQVVDPHGSAAEWDGWEIVGAGRNFSAINKFMKSFDEGITADYEAYSKGQREFPHRSVIGDELTQWGDKCESAPDFITSSCSDIRKVNRHVILISHADTIDKLGGAKGLRKTIDQSAIKLILESEMNADGSYTPTGFGWLNFPRKSAIRVRIPQLDKVVRAIAPTKPALPVNVLDAIDEAVSSSEISKPMQLILEGASSNNGCISVRECQRLKGLKQYSADEIKGFFTQLKQMSLGDIQIDATDSRRWIFWIFSAHDN